MLQATKFKLNNKTLVLSNQTESEYFNIINGMVPRAGFEHATTRSSAERSPRLSYLGTYPGTPTTKMRLGVLKFSESIDYFL